MYDFLKDFASPLTTLLASIVAGAITFVFARTQVRIAQAQKDIALDKLKFDLFQLRYGVYLATKELIQYILFVGAERFTDNSKIDALAVKLDEARFYFPPDICAILHGIADDCHEYLFQMHQDQMAGIDCDENFQQHVIRMRSELESRLNAHFINLPKTFQSSLQFSQLTKSDHQQAVGAPDDSPVRGWMMPHRLPFSRP
jgi:hypothetical protein